MTTEENTTISGRLRSEFLSDDQGPAVTGDLTASGPAADAGGPDRDERLATIRANVARQLEYLTGGWYR